MGKKILVIDDSPSIRQSLAYVLEQEGFNVAQAVDGLDGLNQALADSFDLIVTDINMPNMNGIEFIQKARQNPSYRFTPIVVLTTESGGDKMQEGKVAGATGWIVKPFSADKLISVVKKVIG